MRHSLILSLPLFAILACGTDHHSVARVDASGGSSGSGASALAGAAPTASTGGQSSASGGAPTGGVEAAGAGTRTAPSGGSSTGGKASGGVSASGGTVNTGGARATGGSTPTGGAGTSTGGRGTGTGGTSAGGTGGAGTTGGTSGGAEGGSAGAGTCPAELPLTEDSCSSEGLSCHYTGCTATRDYCSATASCSSGRWEFGYTDCMCPGTGGAAGAGGSPAGGSAGQAGASSSCEFTYSTPSVSSGTCRIAPSSQDSCGEAAQCICADSGDVEGCVANMTVPRGGPTFSDYCGEGSPRSLGDALQTMAAAYGGTAVLSEGCADIPATLEL